MMPPGLVYREGAEFDVPADLGHVEPVLQAMREYLDARGFPDAEWAGLQLATAEALNNAIEHGCAGQPDATTLLRWAWTEEGLAVQIRDPGHFEPPADWAELPEDPLAEGGRGGFLITSYFDRAEHTNDERGHQLTLFKAVPVSPQPPNVSAVEEELGLMTQDLSDSYESLAALFHIGSLLATSKSFDEFLRSVLQRLRALLASDTVYARIHHEDGHWTTHAGNESTDTLPPPTDLTPHELAVWEAQQFRTHDDVSELPTNEPLRHWEAGLSVGPIGFQGKPVGLIVTGRRTGSAFTAGQTNLLRTVADFVGVAHTNARLHRQREEQMRERRELEIAAQIQRSLLPKTFPTAAAWDVHGDCQSARAVGGDFFDVIERDTGHIIVLIADSMGKGVPAAMFASLLRASARARFDATNCPGELLSDLNRLLAPDLANLGMFITATAVTLHPDGHTIDISSAGHPAPMVFNPRENCAVEIQSNGDVPLGVLPDTTYTATRTTLTADQVACLVTDGLFELVDHNDTMLNLGGLAARLPGWWTGDLPSFTTTCLEQLSLIEAGLPADDRTLVVFRTRPPQP